ncbi:MAG: 10 kDa chaperonin 1 [Pirellulaceae bacterium]|nr:MAG: 10 kDa chaperonin 1 [Pirellulaceae bacterium]
MATATATKKTIKLRPLSDRVVIERDEAEEKTAGGIVLPDTAKEKVNRGRVVAVGPGKLTDDGKRVEPSVKPGDHVLINKYGGDEFEFDGGKYVIVRESDILAVIDE